MVLAIYWAWDTFLAYPRERPGDIVRDERQTTRLRISGLWPNALLMAGVIAAVALFDPAKALPGTTWHPWVFLRETMLLLLVGASLLFGSRTIRENNGFTYGAILEVAALFLGIFICMQPALALLNERGASHRLAAGVFLGNGVALERTRQRAHLPRLFQDRPNAPCRRSHDGGR
jgi:Na+/H+ antiporter NhaD/arsenite permease-like protein